MTFASWFLFCFFEESGRAETFCQIACLKGAHCQLIVTVWYFALVTAVILREKTASKPAKEKNLIFWICHENRGLLTEWGSSPGPFHWKKVSFVPTTEKPITCFTCKLHEPRRKNGGEKNFMMKDDACLSLWTRETLEAHPKRHWDRGSVCSF